VPNAIALVSELAHQLPHVPLLTLASPDHVVEWQDAHLAGAMDFVSFPINPPHFFATIERVQQHFSATIARVRQSSWPAATGPKPVCMIAVVGLKGGIGRSTLAANLAVALSQRQTEVVLAEAHHGLGHQSLLLNLRPIHTLANLASEANIDHDLLQGHLQRHQSGLRLLAAPAELAQIVELSVDSWRHILTVLTELAPFVVVDTAATADAVLSTVLTEADEIVVVTGPDIASLYSTRSLLESLRAEQDVHGHIQVVLNQAEVGGGLNAGAIEKHLGVPVQASVLSDPPLAIYAFNRGIPFVLSHPRALISRQIQRLADQWIKKRATQKENAPQTRSRLFSFLSHAGGRG
jgi:pilus assembly protein CpaE